MTVAFSIIEVNREEDSLHLLIKALSTKSFKMVILKKAARGGRNGRKSI